MAQKKAPLEVQQEKETFLEAQKYFVDPNQPSTSGQVRAMSKQFEQLLRRLPTKSVSQIKEFFKSFLALIHDKDVVTELKTLIEDNTKNLFPER